ncbi:4-coumarate-CoA ligase [Magnaporthiopsis poae ATCC 64411]|uniref:4-coumarate-CoA ligase n=1 Tax=Magnaporthiopsis poae (strain ATCC 64411 / 73-15) TaxID=644358 RepID=A0A0C4E8L8_MAGP6|nr:4-coumarate-CoA ligase [Magnaporthiopsis poae ATCC 64411]
MTIKSRFEAPIPRCSLQQWIFGSSREPLPSEKLLMDADRPDDRFLTMAEYRLLAKRIALGLQRAGLKPGDRVLVFSKNSVWFPAVFVGVLMAGGIFTGANPGYVPRELSHQLRDSDASFMLASPEGMPVALEAAAEVKLPRDHVYLFDPELDPKVADPNPPATTVDYAGARHWAELLRDTLARAENWDWTEPTDPASVTCCLNYSSGTTGVPKGVEISHHAYVANCEGVRYVTSLDPTVTERRTRERSLCFLPLYHALAQTYFTANHARNGTPVYYMPSFDFPKMLSHVQKYRITNLTLVPPIVVALAKHPARARLST